MASIKKRPDGKWRVRWRAPDGREHSKHFARKIEADRHLTNITADLLRGAYVDPDDQTTVSQYAKRWLAGRAVGDRTATRLASLVRTHVDGTDLGARRLAAVRPSEAQAWVADRARVLAPSTLRKVVSTARSIYAAAVLDRLVAASPMTRLSLPTAARERVVPLTVDQVRVLADTVASHYRAMVLTQAGLGLRIGELLGLRVGDVDFLRRTVRIEHQAQPKTLDLGPPKTPRSKRTVPLPKMVADALAAHLAAHPASDPVACECPKAETCSRSRSGLVFHTSTARPYDHDYYGGRVFPKAVTAAKLPTGTSSHDLRHHFASVLLAAGESVVAVAEWLGHEDATLVLRVYGHLMANSEDRMRKAVDAAWGPQSKHKINIVADSARTKVDS